MSYGFICGYCGENLETPYGAHHAERMAHELGWRLTLEQSGQAHITCPRCVEGKEHVVPIHHEPAE